MTGGGTAIMATNDDEWSQAVAMAEAMIEGGNGYRAIVLAEALALMVASVVGQIQESGSDNPTADTKAFFNFVVERGIGYAHESASSGIPRRH